MRFAAAILACFAFPAFAAVIQVEVVDANGAAVADAIVYAVPQKAPPAPRVRGEAVIEQIQLQFVPRVTVIRAGTAIQFPNRDSVRHHVYSFSSAKTFEIKLYVGTPAEPVVFDKPGEVLLGCNIHDHMIAHVYVVDTPHFARTDAAGKANLDALPAGEYDLFLRHPAQSAPLPARRVRLQATEAVALKLSLPLKPRPK